MVSLAPSPRAPFAPYAPGYVPRLGPASVLHEAIRDNVETFLEEARERTAHGMGVPPFVEEELLAFLRCGDLAHGFARVRCGDCTAAHLVDATSSPAAAATDG